ncbi:MAG: NAD-dependent deacylase [Candidatus Promineifilaceae bacterium]|nr:NAD-dependent deacylase [Candidatus Promineifilaceae bacterium]
MTQQSIASELIAALRVASHVVALTGSGISAESGVPTFRDAQTGLWSKYEPEELATPAAFKRNPKLVWDWYTWRRELIAAAAPNDAHRALVTLAEQVPHFTLITQNVDGLHQAAGSPSVIELHGNIQRTKCLTEEIIIEQWDEHPDRPPHCPNCGSCLRPDVVWFGEPLPTAALSQALDAVGRCDLFLSVGTSALVQPAASLALEAQSTGAQVAEINLQSTPLSPYADFVLRGQAGKILPTLVRTIIEGPSARS